VFTSRTSCSRAHQKGCSLNGPARNVVGRYGGVQGRDLKGQSRPEESERDTKGDTSSLRAPEEHLEDFLSLGQGQEGVHLC